MSIKAGFVAALLIFVSVGACAQDAKPASGSAPEAPGGAVSDINRRFDDLAADARKHFMQSVADARKVLDQSIADANQKRVSALKDLEGTAMHDKNLELAVAARDEISKPVAEKAAVIPDSSEHREKATIEIIAHIDGSDSVIITQKMMTWKHRVWDMASNVTVNGISWDLGRATDFPNTGDTKYLPFVADFRTARVVSRRGRDTVALEKGDDSMTVMFADSPQSGDDYSITIEVQAAGTQSAAAQ